MPTDDSTPTESAVEVSAEISPEILSAVKAVTDPQRGFESPEAAYEAYSSGHREGDAIHQMRALTDDSQKTSAVQMIIGLGMTAAFDKTRETDVKSLMAKYGLGDEAKLRQPPPGITEKSTDQERQLAMAGMISNPIAFMMESAEYLKTVGNLKRNVNTHDGEILDVVITGETATTMLKQQRGRKPIAFRKSQGGWLVEIEAQLFGKSLGVTTSGSGNIDRFGMGRNKEAQPTIEAISLADVQNAWKVSVNYQQQTAESALQDIADKSGLKIFEQPDFAETLQKKVDVTMNDVAVVRIIEEICTQAGLHPRYKAGAVALPEGPRTLPMTFAGPFLVEATKTQEMLPNAFVRIEFQCFAAGLPSAVCARMAGMYLSSEEKDDSITAAFPDLVAGDGSALVTKADVGFPAKASLSSVQFKTSVQVAKALQNVDRIAEFESRISWMFPQQIHSATFEEIAEGNNVKAGNTTLSITRVRDGAQKTIEMNLDGLTHKELSVTATDADGKAIAGSSYKGETASVYVQEEVKQLVVHVMQDNVRADFPFRFPEIPLANHFDQPAELEQVIIDGDDPLPIEFCESRKRTETGPLFSAGQTRPTKTFFW